MRVARHLAAATLLAACGEGSTPKPVLCDGVRDGNEGIIDSAFDHDGDGYVDRDNPACVEHHAVTDCDDDDPDVHPRADERCNGIDDDCDGDVDELGAVDGLAGWIDADGDGYGDPWGSVLACALGDGIVGDGTDCDDGAATVHPGADELCNEVDDDCDGEIDEGTPADATEWHPDDDDDRYGDPATTVLACEAPRGFVADGTDCDDGDDEVSPGAPEVCNGIDDDCDGQVDQLGGEGEPVWYRDDDGDGYGQSDDALRSCDPPLGYVPLGGDCDDAAPDVHPGVPELCNGLDDDCNGIVDDGPPAYPDEDRDGYGVGVGVVHSCVPPLGYAAADGDCGPRDATIHPGAVEVCNGLDDDCDGGADDADPDGPPAVTWYVDADGDGDGAGAPVAGTGCTLPAGYAWTRTDCDDADPDVRAYVAYVDADGDGYGAGLGVARCGALDGMSTVGGDCDDAASDVYPGAPESCDGPDANCDGVGCDLLPVVWGEPDKYQRIGWAYSAAGDLTGDGVPDLVVGRMFDDPRALTVYAGPVSEAMDVVTAVVAAEEYHHELGAYATILDVDDDGAPDLLAGPYRHWLGVYAGPLDGTYSSDDTTAEFVASGFVTSVRRATALLEGDVDALVFREYDDRLSIVPTGLPSTDDVDALAWATIETGSRRKRVARASTTGRDWDGDGIDDVALNQIGRDPRSQNAVVAVGTGPLSGTYVWDDLPIILDGGEFDWYHGLSMEFAPDLDGDGYAELVVGGYYGAYFYQHVPPGVWRASGVMSYAMTGGSWSPADAIATGDFDGDGQPDLALGDYSGGSYRYGAFDVYLGPLGADFSPEDAVAHWESVVEYGYLGAPMEVVPDLQGNGRDSLLVAEAGPDAGTIFLMLGSQIP